MTWRNGEEVPEGGNWTRHPICPHVRLAGGSLMSTCCQRLFSPQDFSKSLNVLHIIVSLQPISHSLNVCQAEFKIVPPRSILVHSWSQNYLCSICAVFLYWDIIPNTTFPFCRNILQTWMFYLLWYVCRLCFLKSLKIQHQNWGPNKQLVAKKSVFMLSVFAQAASNRGGFGSALRQPLAVEE